MGEYIDISPVNGGLGAVTFITCLIAIVLFAIFQDNPGNDDDDSDSGGGGLMQPVS